MKLVNIIAWIARSDDPTKVIFKRKDWPEAAQCHVAGDGDTIQFTHRPSNVRKSFTVSVSDMRADDWVLVDLKLGETALDEDAVIAAEWRRPVPSQPVVVMTVEEAERRRVESEQMDVAHMAAKILPGMLNSNVPKAKDEDALVKDAVNLARKILAKSKTA